MQSLLVFVVVVVIISLDNMVVYVVQLKGLNIPIESGLTAGLMDGRGARQDEHKQMKELVLNWERRQEEEAYQGECVYICL